MDTWIELGNARFVAASELSAASFRHPLCCCGCVKQPDPVNTRDIKAAYGRRGKVMPVGNPFCYHIVFLKLPLNHGFLVLNLNGKNGQIHRQHHHQYNRPYRHNQNRLNQTQHDGN
jgi:hypothetical protein